MNKTLKIYIKKEIIDNHSQYKKKNIKKKIMMIIIIILMKVLIAGYSSKIEDELVTLQNDMKENVGDSIADDADEFEQKGIDVENGDISPDEFLTYYDEEEIGRASCRERVMK